jgi:cytochrome c peroxidase
MKGSQLYLLLFTFISAVLLTTSRGASSWSPRELELISSLTLSQTTSMPSSPTNAVADDPRAVRLGHKLFFDKRLSAEGNVACATCHQPNRAFTDGKALSEGIGMTTRNAPTVVGAAYNVWQFWDGRSDSLWSQALGPLENPSEHGFTRAGVAHLIANQYRNEYEALFGLLPDFEDLYRFPERATPVGDAELQRAWSQMSETDRGYVNRVFANVGKAIEAYERQLNPGRSRFDRYAQSLSRNADGSADLNSTEVAGLRLFLGRANCVACHNGPQFTDGRFHNTGVPRRSDVGSDVGRSGGLETLKRSEFSCSSPYSDAPRDCNSRIPPASSDTQVMRAYKTPSLRMATVTAPYMHAGQFASLSEALRHYRAAPRAALGNSEIQPLNLTDQELLELEAFIRSLAAAIDAPAALLNEPAR